METRSQKRALRIGMDKRRQSRDEKVEGRYREEETE
jgi:hypothetical protein